MTLTHARFRPLPLTIASALLAVVGAAGLTVAVSPAGATTTVTARSSSSSFQALRPGDRGPRVRFVQRAARIPVTGTYGPRTRRNITRLQNRWNFDPTGVVNHRTWTRLQARWDRIMDRWRGKFRAVMRVARAQAGAPYQFGAAGPNAFDCSGYTLFVYQRATGRTLPHLANLQYRPSQRISRANARPGDLVFFPDSGGNIYHVAIWAGRGRIWHSSRPGTVVDRDPLWTSRVWFARLIPKP